MKRQQISRRRGALYRLPILFLSLILLFFALGQVSAVPQQQGFEEQKAIEGGGNEFIYISTLFNNFSGELPPPTSLLAPEIVSFSAEESAITSGESTQLNWQINGTVESLVIDNGVGEVTGLTSIEVAPSSTTTYEMTATNSAGSTTAEVTITVDQPLEPPQIESFSASPAEINSGQTALLEWQVTGYDSLEINQGIGDVSGETEYQVSPDESTTYTLTAVNAAGESSSSVTITVVPSSGDPQIVIFDWNGEVTVADRGFPKNQPPLHNYNWKSPINYAAGTAYARAEIFSQPTAQPQMYLQFCFWQEKDGNNFALETCMKTEHVPGDSGTVRCWSQPIAQMWKLNGVPLEWERPRFRVAVPVKVLKTIDGVTSKYPVSDFNGWDWYGEDENAWYPLDMRFTVIVVPPGGTFSGWGSYGGC